MGFWVHLHVEPANRATGWEIEPMTAIAKILLIVILTVGALGLAGCKRHRFRHRPRRHSRISVVDHDRYDTRGVDVHVSRPRDYDRHDGRRHR